MLYLNTLIAIILILVGIALSIRFFGTGGKRSNVFNDIYYSVEDIDGIGVIYTKTGEYSAVLRITNPVQKYSADINGYYGFVSLMTNIMQTLGEGYAMHKQDIFATKTFNMRKAMAQRDAGKAENQGENFLSDSYFRFFDGRKYTDASTYIVITQECVKSRFLSYDDGKWKDFLIKIKKVYDQLATGGVQVRFLNGDETSIYVDRYYAMNFRNEKICFNNFKVDDNLIHIGTQQAKVYSLVDVDNIALPSLLYPFYEMNINGSKMPMDIMAELDHVPDANTLIFNQIIYIPNQKTELAKLEKKRNRMNSMPSPSNLISVDDIDKVRDIVARDGKQLVYAHFNMVVSMDADKDIQKTTNYLENIFARQNIHISKRAYNQLELFVGSFPGNCYNLDKDYDRFLTLSDAAMCLMYKECQSKSEESPLKFYFTDRNGVPEVVDVTGKEGKVKHTNNSNFFVLGPSGSGKSFFMNCVMRQYYEQNTDCVIVDTGDSYEGLCEYFNGTYISYSKEKPISMNPFKISELEYNENFGEKKNFLKSLIFLIFKGNALPTKIEETIINRVLNDYYIEYFNPFNGFTDDERKELKQKLLLTYKSSGEYGKFEEELRERNGASDYDISEDVEYNDAEKMKEKAAKIQAVIDDSASTDGEKEKARNVLMRITPAVIEGKFLQKIERQIARIEHQRKTLKVTELSFNSFYEYSSQRIPQIMEQDNIKFAIDDYRAILAPFYKGGELSYILNNDMDATLFDQKFIIFEIDKVKDDAVLFPIIVLIIMDVFTQKMRIKSNRKCLVIEEAWKAIATPIMAEYIKYLYKTARKHWAMVGVVTQDIQDITSSPIVKEAIINNSDVFMLLDQSKSQNKFDDIKATLALTDIECKKIFTINRLENKEGRSPFKEVFIKRAGNETVSDVYGVEEPLECYMTYTTEKVEKLALKLYKKERGYSHQQAIEAFVRDYKASGLEKTLDFAKMVLEKGTVA